MVCHHFACVLCLINTPLQRVCGSDNFISSHSPHCMHRCAHTQFIVAENNKQIKEETD